MKPKIFPKDLEGMKFADYRKLFFKELKRMKAAYPDASQGTLFILISEWEFPDFAGKKIPLMIIGDLTSEWKKFYKTDAKKRREKDFCLGKCSFGTEESDGQNFNLEITHGRIKPVGAKALDKVLLRKVSLKTNVTKGEGTDDDSDLGEDDQVTDSLKKAAVAGVAGAAANKKTASAEEIAKLKEEGKSQALELSKLLANFKAQFASIQKEVYPKLKSGQTARKDLVLVRDLQATYSEFMELYGAAIKAVQNKFSSAKKTLDSQNQQVAKIALAVKEKKQSLAEQLANYYFSKRSARSATEEEVQNMQNSLKLAFEYRKINDLDGDSKRLNLKAIYATARYLGPAFQTKHTDIVYQKIAKA